MAVIVLPAPAMFTSPEGMALFGPAYALKQEGRPERRDVDGWPMETYIPLNRRYPNASALAPPPE